MREQIRCVSESWSQDLLDELYVRRRRIRGRRIKLSWFCRFAVRVRYGNRQNHDNLILLLVDISDSSNCLSI